LFGVVTPLMLPAMAVSADDVASSAVQEISLDSLGVGSQAVYGITGVTQITFPPPAAHLAVAGSFVRLFFAHSTNLGSGSSGVVAINGQPLSTIPLSNSTAAGGVVEVRLPLNLVSEQSPNRLEVRFTMHSVSEPAPAESDLYGRLDGQTMIHYQFAAPAGLQTYPFSLLAEAGFAHTVGVVLTSQSGREELASALRVIADLGRRSGPQRPDVTLIASDPNGWLTAGNHPAIVISRLDHLPSPAIEATSWKRGDKGLTGPDGKVLAPDDGFLAMTTSPWDRRSPLVLVTGATDTAVAKATAALVGASGLSVGGDSTVVSKAEPGSTEPVESVALNMSTPRELLPTEPGRYRTSVGFAAPPVAPDATSQLELRVPSFKSAAAKPTFLAAELNGQRIGTASLDPASADSRQLQFSFPGRVLRPGSNGVTLEYLLRTTGPQAAPGAQDTGDDTLTGSLALPRLNVQSTDLRTLPYPFFQANSRRTVVAITDEAQATLDAAALTMMGLGARSATPPPHLGSRIAPSSLPGKSDLIVVGPAPGSGQLAGVAGRLPIAVSDSVGTLQQAEMSSGDGQVLWVGGSKETLNAAARALANVQLRGHAVTVDAAGHVQSASSVTSPGGRLASFGLPKLLAVLAGAVLALTLGLQLVRPRRKVAI
jgi:hypothetical protein